jgi:hypothetical protein
MSLRFLYQPMKEGNQEVEEVLQEDLEVHQDIQGKAV